MPQASEKAIDLAAQKQHAAKVVRRLKRGYPNVTCALTHNSAYQLVVATILSAQCTDERVNATTPALFEKYPHAQDLADSRQADVEQIIKPLGFFRAKATNIRGMATKLIEDFDGELPRTLDEMTSLPGVGRKTANVVLGTWFGLATGVVVDTHVKRISGLIGLTESKNPEIIERDLIKVLPKSEWINYSHRLIHHGRAVCIARRPKCADCVLLDVCQRVGLPPLEDVTVAAD
ncbi:MAG: endonuclease III [Planctomycetota bacterium]|nr:endonuclease III [Planctomycetota bacterium]